MLNEQFRITPRNDSSCDISWTSTWSNGVSWVFVNGKHLRGPIYAQTAQRMTKIPLGVSEVLVLEIHDFPDDSVVPAAINTEPNTRPTLSWNAVPNAARYRVYHKERDGAESLIYDRAATDALERYEINCPISLSGQGGIWHFIRVEAVDEFGNESTTACWSYFAFGLPAPPAQLSVTAGSIPGTYNIGI